MGNYTDILDSIEAKHRLLSGNVHNLDRLSSGMLVPDLVVGGGLLPGVHSISGPEQSAKSTMTFHVLGSAIKSQIPIVVDFDAEGAVDPVYLSSILRVKSLDEVFGKRDSKRNWIVEPKARYEQDNVAEVFFRFLRSILRTLPEKVYLPEHKQWFLVYENSKLQKEAMESQGYKPIRSLSGKGFFYCESPDTKPQAVVILDSWPQLMAEKCDEEEGNDNGMALMAGVFSKEFKKTAGQIRKKGMILYGVNQIRLNPGARFQNPEYEPGGEALKYVSSVRNQIRARAVPEGWPRKPKSSGVCEEEGINGGVDAYAFKHIANTKNKTGTPFLNGWMRVWVSDKKGKAHGFDPVYDTFAYLSQTGQVEGSHNKQFTVNINDKKITTDWINFKRLILSETKKPDEKVLKLFKHNHLKPFKIRAACFKQLASGQGSELLSEVASNGADSEDLEE
jgi:RecA/RadA recombinase